MFKFSMEKIAQESPECDLQSLVEQAQALSDAKQELIDANKSLEELEVVCDNVSTAIESIKQCGVTVENMALLNADDALNELAHVQTKLESLEGMSEQAVASLESKYLVALEEQELSLWQRFIAMIKRMWAAIKTFFRNLWLKLKSFFKKDKEWYQKAVAASDRLEKEPELKKTVDELIKTAEIKDGQVVWNEGLLAKFKSFFKNGSKATEAFEVIGLEDYVLSLGVDTSSGGEVSAKGSGFIRYDQVEPLVNMIKDGIGSIEKQLKAEGTTTPIAWAAAKLREELNEFVPSKEITHEDIQKMKFNLIGKAYEGIGKVMCHMPDFKAKLKSGTKGILDLTKCEFYFTGTVFKLECELKVKTTDGKLGELGWTRKNILDAYNTITKVYDILDGQNYGEAGKVMIEAFEKLKFADDVRSEDKDLIRNVIALEVRATRFVGQQYSTLLKHLARARRFLTLVPERLWVNREFNVDVTKKIA